MHLSLNLFLFVAFLMLAIAVEDNNDSMVYFPTDEGYLERSMAYSPQGGRVQAVGVAPAYLEKFRGTSVYKKYVDDIIAQGMSKLTLQVNKLLKSQTKNRQNVLFSPFSITGALALVLLGSNGITFKQVSEVWGLQTGIPDIHKKSQIVHEQFGRIIRKVIRTSGFQLGDEVTSASAVFVQEGYPIRPIYRSSAEQLYQSSIINVDFESNPREAQVKINNWVSETTKHKIKDILVDVPSSHTRVILANALYFNAEWENHFFSGSTKRRPFYIDGKQSKSNIEADMMSNGGEFPYYKDNQIGCEILGLPYKGNRSTMYIILPFDSSRQKLAEFESRITEVDLDNLVSKTKMTGAVILFPRMKIESTINLRDTLKSLGVTSLFDAKQANLALLSSGLPEKNAPPQGETLSLGGKNFDTHSIDNIRQLINEESSDNNYQNPGLYVDQVIHKVFMDITEKGTEAAASTAVSLTKDGSRVTFRVDVPFCFFIRHDETKAILFWGSIVVPNPNYQ